MWGGCFDHPWINTLDPRYNEGDPRYHGGRGKTIGDKTSVGRGFVFLTGLIAIG